MPLVTVGGFMIQMFSCFLAPHDKQEHQNTIRKSFCTLSNVTHTHTQTPPPTPPKTQLQLPEESELVVTELLCE